jgi:TonB-dependent SusC/RagA subfamily outer membrane receptor
MRTPGQRPGARWIIVAASVLGGCAPQPASLSLLPAPVTPNAPFLSAAPSAVAASAPAAPRGEISLSESARYANVQELLMARAPGLEVRPLGIGQFSMLVRGRSSLSDNREPLVVIDGMPFTQNGAEVLAGMAPRDIKRVDVLRDASVTGVYGSRAANGVVVVTTRHGDY